MTFKVGVESDYIGRVTPTIPHTARAIGLPLHSRPKGNRASKLRVRVFPLGPVAGVPGRDFPSILSDDL